MHKTCHQVTLQVFRQESKLIVTHFLSAALVPGQVQNLRSTLDTNQPSLTLTCYKPKNVKSDRDVSNYDIRFRPSGSVRESDYCEGNVKASATSVHLTRRNRLKPLIKYDFEVRARNSGHNGNWSTVSKYIGMDTPLYMFILYLVLNIDFMALYIHMLIKMV